MSEVPVDGIGYCPWVWIELVVATAGLATMRAAIDRGDIDEASRQGVLAGPAVIEEALAAVDRSARLAGIAAAPQATDRLELLAPLARTAAGPDRRVAIPAAHAARTIARDFGHRDLPDDIAVEDIATWAAEWTKLARDRERWIELRVVALDVAVALDRAVDLGPMLVDPDAAFRRAAIEVIPMPVPVALHAPLATVVAKDNDPAVALAAAATLCTDLATDPPQPILAALGQLGLDRIKSLVTGSGPKLQLADAKRCLR